MGRTPKRVMAISALLAALSGGVYAARELTSGNASVSYCVGTAHGWHGHVNGPLIRPVQPVLERRVIIAVNAYRRENGLPRLRPGKRLGYLARWHSRDEYLRGYFAHERRGSALTQRFARYTPSTCIAENLSRGNPTAQGIVNAWKNSPPHRHVMLLTWVRWVGVGAYSVFVTADFSS